MPAAIRCAICQRLLQVRDADLGKMVRCPSCAQAFVAHSDSDATIPPAAAVPDFELSNEEKSVRKEVRSEADNPTPSPQPQRRRTVEPGGETYAVQLDADAAAPAPARRRRRRMSRSDDEYDDVQPHRGVLVMVLGILSIVLSCIPLAGWILGGISMAMGSHDERLMEVRAMDRSGRAMTKAGMICGIIGVFLATVWFLIAMFLEVRSRS